MEPTDRGILIAVEGMDGSGKSTQAMLLFNWIRALGLPVHHTEWNSSPVVAAATKVGKDTKRLKPQTFHLIHAADFADRWSKQIEPMLEVGGIVICDRYKFTAMARDGARGVDRTTIEGNYSFAREPDIAEPHLARRFGKPVCDRHVTLMNGRGDLAHLDLGSATGGDRDRGGRGEQSCFCVHGLSPFF